MNIIVRTYSQKVIVRPDTTLVRNEEDFYPPEFVSTLDCTPVVFARISKAGRSVGRQFASRYYDALGYGVLLYPVDLMTGDEEDFACASCLDHSSYLPPELVDRESFNWDGGVRVLRDGEEFFCCDGVSAALIEDAISQASRYVYVRRGDYIAIELAKRSFFCGSGQDGLGSEVTVAVQRRDDLHSSEFRIIY